jgi:flagellar biosynthesis protein FlhA
MASVAAPRASSLPRGGLRDLILPVGIIASVLVILVPLPPALMDVLLACNISIAVIVLLTTIYIKTPLEFSVFPSLLLATTLGRLVLNVATTRLILSDADKYGVLAAGHVVKSFGEFVAGDRIEVGIIIFFIIAVIQFVVITKGATRISEVAARFALDGMPGRQMAIDADLNAGVIDQREAQQRRAELSQQTDFFGAMDGASKFVRGDAIAGIIIILINIVGGLVIGVAEGGMSIAEAGSVYTKLTIGDGLVTQVPALLISLAAGLLVTRSTQASNLPNQFLTQLFSRPEALIVTAGFLGLLIFTSLPAAPLLTIGVACAGLAFTLRRREKEVEAADEARVQAEAKKPTVERVEDYLAIDPMEIEIGVGLIRLADPKRGGDLLERIQRVRQSMATEMGLIMPKVRIRDNLRLEQNQYRIKVSDIPVAVGLMYPNMQLAIETARTTGRMSGIPAKDPVSGSAAVWIDSGNREEAESLGYKVVEPVSILTAHLSDLVRLHADEILTRDATKHLVDELKKTSPAVVDELIPSLMKLAEVQQVLHLLLREEVSIRQLGPILETLGEHAARTKDPLVLTEQVRQRLARNICARYRSKSHRMLVVTLDPELEEQITAGIEQTDPGITVSLPPRAAEAICQSLAAEVEKLTADGHPPIVLVSPQIRAGLKQLTIARLPRLVVLSYHEITRDTQIESIGIAALLSQPTHEFRRHERSPVGVNAF